nr:carboxylesterase family protein [Pseudomonas luteola]
MTPSLKKLMTLGLLMAPLGAFAQPGALTEVGIDSGRLKGSQSGDVISFKGIPFAAPPVGENRWRAPQRVKPWRGVREATAYGADCMQKPMASDAAPLGVEPSEDCLYLNVWRPAQETANRKATLPVVVWIYGGGYVNGGASPSVYDGSAFARDGVVFVSFNYRIGRFGFFAHPALTAAKEGPLGNYGYMDQIAALQWVKRNIRQFGGDPNNVTVMGESAGGGSVLNITTTPLTRGLFDRAIVMSGGGRSLMGELHEISRDLPGNPSAETIGKNFARSVGVEGTGSKALKALRELPASRVLGDLNMMTMGSNASTYVGGPVLDGRVVVGTPEQVYSAGQENKVPMLIGSTSADLGFNTAKTMEELFAPFGREAERARQLYDPENTGDVQAVGAAVAMDRMMTEPARFVASKISQHDRQAFLYRFSYVADSLRSETKGAQHASEIPYFFKTLEARYGDKVTDKDQDMANEAHAIFVNFIKTGNPNGTNVARWLPFNREGNLVMDFAADEGPVLKEDPWKERLDLIEKTQHAKP